MNKGIKQKLLIILGWFFVLLGAIGAILPILPTTVFLIIALAIFSKSSPRFHQMLLENRFFGEDLKRWEQTKTISRKSKKKATYVIVVTFSVSIAVLYQKTGLQLMLMGIATLLLFIIWKLKESK